MKNYDFKKAKKLIKENESNLESASLGMHEDWAWTADTVWENGEYKAKLGPKTTIGGISGSYWATPTLQLIFKDGTDKMIPCHNNGESKPRKYDLGLGVISGPVQERITPLSEINQ